MRIEARPGALQDDGTLPVFGSVRITGAVSGSRRDGGAVSERTVDALYVADLEVQLASDGLNFRSWMVTLTADRLAAFTTTMPDGSKQAQLPVRAYVHNGCVVDMPDDRQPVLVIAKPAR